MDLVSGNISLEQIAKSDIYSEVLSEGVGKFIKWYDEVSNDELEEAMENERNE